MSHNANLFFYYVSTCHPINCIQILQDNKKTAPPVAYSYTREAVSLVNFKIVPN